MRLAEHEGERHDEELITEIIVDVQDPVAPILEAARLDEGSHDRGRVITRFGEVIYRRTASIDQHLPRIGAVKIQLGHRQPASPGHKDVVVARTLDRRPVTGSGDAVKI
jgi:hypothetical protein